MCVCVGGIFLIYFFMFCFCWGFFVGRFLWERVVLKE